MPTIENPMSSADQNPEMASIMIHGSRLNLSVMNIQKLARMEDQKSASIFYVRKDLGGLWRQIHLDEVRTTKCLELLQQLAKELSPPTEEVPIDVLRTKQDQPKTTSAIKHPEEFDPKPGFDLTCPKILLPAAYIDPCLRLKFVFPISKLILKLVLSSRACADVGLRLPPSGLGVTIPEPVDVTKPEPIDVTKPEPIDVTKPGLSAHIKNDPRVQAIQEKMAAQVKVCGEKEIRVKEATENTRRQYGPWVKAMKKAGKDLKIEKGKLKKLRREEENILAEIGELEETK